MSKSYATILQKLCHDYMSHKLSFEDYRRKRKILLLKIDEQFNGSSQENENDAELTSPGLPSGEFGIASFQPENDN